MPAATTTVRVKGLARLHRELERTEKKIRDDVHRQIRRSVEPVRRDAELFARRRISRIGPRWFRMRTGVTRHGVYIAPVMRSTRVRADKRPNLARRFVREALRPALRKNRTKVRHDLQRVVDRNVQRFNRAGGR